VEIDKNLVPDEAQLYSFLDTEAFSGCVLLIKKDSDFSYEYPFGVVYEQCDSPALDGVVYVSCAEGSAGVVYQPCV
jgi:hypothetical protein